MTLSRMTFKKNTVSVIYCSAVTVLTVNITGVILPEVAAPDAKNKRRWGQIFYFCDLIFFSLFLSPSLSHKGKTKAKVMSWDVYGKKYDELS